MKFGARVSLMYQKVVKYFLFIDLNNVKENFYGI